MRPLVSIVSVVGENSTGKSELTKQLLHEIIAPFDGVDSPLKASTFSVGNIARFCAEFPGGFPLESPEQVRQSASDAIANVHIDLIDGNYVMKPNGLDHFLQTAHNGFESSTLANNLHFSEFTREFVSDFIETRVPTDTLVIVDGRERWKRWLRTPFETSGILIRTHAPPEVRAAFFYQERPEAKDWPIKRVLDTILTRSVLDDELLIPARGETQYVIDVTRTDPSVEKTNLLAQKISGVLFDCQQGAIPSDFEAVPLQFSDVSV